MSVDLDPTMYLVAHEGRLRDSAKLYITYHELHEVSYCISLLNSAHSYLRPSPTLFKLGKEAWPPISYISAPLSHSGYLACVTMRESRCITEPKPQRQVTIPL